MINISFIEYKKPLKDNMWFTAEPFYQNIDMDFESLEKFVKTDKKQISPYFYKFRQKNKDGWDNSRQNLLMFDVDDGISINHMQDILQEHAYLIYTTKSHQKVKQGKICDRFRVIVPAINIPRDSDVYFTMLKLMRKIFHSDKQTENKTAGFLCNGSAETYTNTGRSLDCQHFADKAETIVALEAKIKLLKQEERTIKRNEYQSKGKYDLDPQELKTLLEIDDMIEIVDSLGYEVSRQGMFTMRDERTPSCKIYHDNIYDFGSGYNVDIFGLVMDRLSISFPESLEYVNSFIRR